MAVRQVDGSFISAVCIPLHLLIQRSISCDHADAGRMHLCRIVVVSFVLDDLTWNSCLYGQAGFSLGPLSRTVSVAIVTYMPHLVCYPLAVQCRS